MNSSHSKLTDWGLGHIAIEKNYTILDVGCGGGRTVNKLATIATQGKVYGVDYSEESVAATRKINAALVEAGRVEVRHGSVSELPFSEGVFDLVTAVETHFWWPNLATDMREVFRVVKPGGALIVVADVYKGANTMTSRLAEKYASRTGMTLLSADEHRELFANAGYSDVQVIEERGKGWIYCVGRKPSSGQTATQGSEEAPQKQNRERAPDERGLPEKWIRARGHAGRRAVMRQSATTRVRISVQFPSYLSLN
jgi:ubiquinone/menaquinone biosynthesis C-methylase UbiE